MQPYGRIAFELFRCVVDRTKLVLGIASLQTDPNSKSERIIYRIFIHTSSILQGVCRAVDQFKQNTEEGKCGHINWKMKNTPHKNYEVHCGGMSSNKNCKRCIEGLHGGNNEAKMDWVFKIHVRL